MISHAHFRQRTRAFITALVVFPLVSASHGASFDCAKASNLVENAVCSDTKVTESFKRAHKKFVGHAYQEGASEDEGLDADPVFDAQDYPDKGFRVRSCDAATNVVMLKGIDPNAEQEPFEVAVKTVKTERGWLVDGAGIINIPRDQQARRE